jgi:site-specific recombinase XerD
MAYIRKRNNGYYYANWKEKRSNGQWYTMADSLQTKNKTLAQKRFNAKFPYGFSDAKECYLGEWMVEYRRTLGNEQLDSKTLSKYLIQAETFIKFFNGRIKRLSECRHEHIIEFQSSLSQKGFSLSTIAGYGRGLRKMFNIAANLEYVRKNPMAKIKVGKMEQRQRFFNPDDMKRIIDAAQGNDFNLALVLFMFQTGFRIQEVVDSRWENISLSNRTITVVGKGKKRRLQKIPALAYDAIVRLQGKGPTIFGKKQKQLYRDVKDVLDKAGVKGSPHTFRDTYATYSVKVMPVSTLRDRMGHGSLIQTDKYTHALNSDVPSEVMKYFEDWKIENG